MSFLFYVEFCAMTLLDVVFAQYYLHCAQL